MLKLGLKSRRVLSWYACWLTVAHSRPIRQKCVFWTYFNSVLNDKRYDEQSYLICLYEHFCYELTAFIKEKCICKCFRKQSYTFIIVQGRIPLEFICLEIFILFGNNVILLPSIGKQSTHSSFPSPSIFWFLEFVSLCHFFVLLE